MKIHKGDTVQIRGGKDAGKTGKVLKVDAKTQSIVVEGLNVFKKHQRPRKQGEKGQMVSLARPLNNSKVMLYCSRCKKGVRIGHRFEGSKKIRFCKKCETAI